MLREARDEDAVLRVDARRAAQLVAAAEDVAALIARPEIDVQGQTGNDAAGGFGLKLRRRPTGRRSQAAEGQLDDIADAEPPRGAEARQRREQGRNETVAHLPAPLGQAAPG